MAEVGPKPYIVRDGAEEQGLLVSLTYGMAPRVLSTAPDDPEHA